METDYAKDNHNPNNSNYQPRVFWNITHRSHR